MLIMFQCFHYQPFAEAAYRRSIYRHSILLLYVQRRAEAGHGEYASIIDRPTLRPKTRYPQPLLDLRAFRDINHQPDLDDLQTTLQACIVDFKHVYLIIDALDECPLANNERSKLLEVLKNMQRLRLANLHMLCTSRPEPDIEAKLGPLFNEYGSTIIDLQERRKDVNRDIRTYIDKKIELSEFRSWRPDTKEEVKAHLTGKAHGM